MINKTGSGATALVEKVALVAGLTDKVLCEGSIPSLRSLGTNYNQEITLSCKMKDSKRKPCGRVDVTMVVEQDPASMNRKKKTTINLPDDFKGGA